MKKLLSLTMVVFMLAAMVMPMLAVPAAAASNSITFEVKTASGTVAPGGTVVVYVSIKETSPFYQAGCKLHYDTNALTYLSNYPASVAGNSNAVVPEATGDIYVTLKNSSFMSSSTYTGTIVTFTFTANTAYNGYTKLTVDVNSALGGYTSQYAPFDVRNGAETTLLIGTGTHTHSFTEKNTDAKYLITAASCKTKATYYYSCLCGEKGTSTFESGELAAHTWTWVVDTPATATADGVKHEQCTVCQAKQNENTVIPATGGSCIHVLMGTAKVESTCTVKGRAAYYTCTKCSKVFADTNAATEVTDITTLDLPLAEHKAEKLPAVIATCTDAGKTEGSKCSVCGAVITAQETIPAAGHKWTWIIDKEATDTTDGVKHEECTVCRAKQSENTVIPATSCAHDLKKTDKVDATCLKAGNKAYWTCSKCGKYFSDEAGKTETTLEAVKIAQLEHKTEILAAVAATCTENGKTAGEKCTVCGTVTKAQTVIKATGHKWKDVIDVAATATTAGSKHTECTVCGAKGATTVIPVVTCKHTTIKQVAAVAATCSAKGCKAYYTCTSCGTNFSDAKGKTQIKDMTTLEIATVAHTAVKDAAVEATCSSQGKTEGSHCSVCNTVIVAQNAVPALEHKTETRNAREATCSTAGYTGDRVCTVCGATVSTGAELSKTAHTIVLKNEKAATCTAEGYTGDRVCSVCQETVEAGKTIEKTAHEYDNGICKVCGEKNPNASSEDPATKSGGGSNAVWVFVALATFIAGFGLGIVFSKIKLN